MPVGHAKFDMNGCNESPLQGEKPDFWPVSKFNTGSLSLRSILPAIMYYSEVIVLTPLLYVFVYNSVSLNLSPTIAYSTSLKFKL